MKQMINILDEDLEYVDQERLYGEDLIYVKSKISNGICPYCGQESGRTHSTYDKRLLNFMVGNKEVRVILMNRKLFCDNAACSHTTFAQKLPVKPDLEDREERFKESYRTYVREAGLKVS